MGPLNRQQRLLLTARDACRVPDPAVDAAHLLKLPPSSRESLRLFDHVRCPFVGILKEHGADSLLAVIARASPTAPHPIA